MHIKNCWLCFLFCAFCPSWAKMESASGEASVGAGDFCRSHITLLLSLCLFAALQANVLVARGQLWRLVTPVLLHGDMVHLLVRVLQMMLAASMVAAGLFDE